MTVGFQGRLLACGKANFWETEDKIVNPEQAEVPVACEQKEKEDNSMFRYLRKILPGLRISRNVL